MVGLHHIYKKYNVPEDSRQVYRSAWDVIEKGLKNAAKEGQFTGSDSLQHRGACKVGQTTETGDCDCNGCRGKARETEEEKAQISA